MFTANHCLYFMKMPSRAPHSIPWSLKDICKLLILITSLLFLGGYLKEYTRSNMDTSHFQSHIVSTVPSKYISSFFEWFNPLFEGLSSRMSVLRWKAIKDDQLNESMAIQKIITQLQNNVRIKLKMANALARKKLATLTYRTICQGYFLTVNTTRERLGNLMFQTASLLGISEKIKRPPVFLKRFHGHDVFSSFWIPNLIANVKKTKVNCSWNTDTSSALEKFIVLKETGAGTYTPEMMRQDLGREGKPILLTGNLQSWRYFKNIKTLVKLLFTFKKSIYNTAIKIIGQKLANYGLNNSTKFFKPTIVGVHIRRGDFVVNLEGLEPATDNYLLNNLKSFRMRYKRPIFLVASDDKIYCEKLFRHNVGKDVFVLDENPPAVHMAVLSLANHLIISTGTFGWWAAYLSEAESVFYYGNYPRNGSVLKPQFLKDDYFPLDWLDGA